MPKQLTIVDAVVDAVVRRAHHWAYQGAQTEARGHIQKHQRQNFAKESLDHHPRSNPHGYSFV